MGHTIITDIIPARHSGWMGRMIGVWFSRWWWLVSIAVGIPVILGLIVKVEWLLVALMIILIGYPGLLWWIYVQYGLRGEGRLAMLPRKIMFADNHFTIHYLAPADQESAMTSVSVDYQQVTDLTFTASSMTIEWDHENPWAYVRIPIASFSSRADYESAANLIVEKSSTSTTI